MVEENYAIMKNKILNYSPIVISAILMIISLFRHNGISGGMFLFSGIMWIEAILALKKTRGANPLKAWFRSRGKLEILRIIYMCLYGIFFAVGSCSFIAELF